MAGVPDSDADARSHWCTLSSQDLELAQAGSVFVDASDHAAAACQSQSSSEPALYGSFFEDAFVSPASPPISPTYTYPSPDVACNYQPDPYPATSTEAKRQIDICRRTVECCESGRCSSRDALTSEPGWSTPAVDLGQPVGTPARDIDSGLGTSPSLNAFSIPYKGAQSSPTEQPSARPSWRAGPEEVVAQIVNVFPDTSIPYVVGTAKGEQGSIQSSSDAMIAIANGDVSCADLICDVCQKVFGSKSDLSHHKISHDDERAHKHKCKLCGKGFRYPKDLRRHEASKHQARPHNLLQCAICSKTFARSDNLRRHLKSESHRDARVDASVHSAPSTSLGQQNIPPQTSQGFLSVPQPPPDSVSNIRLQLSVPDSRVYRSSTGSAAAGSTRDSSTFSGVSSFISESF